MRQRGPSAGRRIRRAAATVVIAALAGCSAPTTRWVAPTASGANTGPAPTAGTVTWRPCQDLPQRLFAESIPNVRFDCGTLRVPRDWDAPAAGATFNLALVRARRTDQRSRIGSLLVNPGGPGVGGVDYAVYFAASGPVDVLRRFDVIGFDPRGVGGSAPVECVTDAQKDAGNAADPDPVSDAAYAAHVAFARRIGDDCAAKYGQSLRLFSTEQTARDMEAIRAAVGDPKLTYLGYSYGTLLGAVYAHRYPTRIRALVLDGAVDPTQDAVAASEGQARGFERAYGDFVAWCRATPIACPAGPDARATVNRLMAAARQAPVTGPDGRPATAGWVLLALVTALYQRDDWPELAAALHALDGGDSSAIFRIADRLYSRDPTGHYSNLIDANLAIGCADEDRQPTAEQIRALQGAWRAAYPTFGADLAVSMLGCAVWPGKHDPFEAGRAAGAPPILVVGTKGDPATPYEQTAALASLLGTGVVLTWNGDGHTAYPDTPCITEAVDRYLIDLRVPPVGTVCPAR